MAVVRRWVHRGGGGGGGAVWWVRGGEVVDIMNVVRGRVSG